ncbi:hypothetical protein AVEN_122700-1 [Araneus ventricosus]|uniref:Uncharacterized protein n=1 Tax=Araneus ventricosus TaxID=182803 RepID=A0A4Y2UQL7_ARAVE|nr:hypothetical protein AVEN_122700-1 [Araneus ventricosus]
MKDSEEEKLYDNSFQRSLLENFTNKIEDSSGFGSREFPIRSLSKRGMEQKSDAFAFIGNHVETISEELVQHNASNKTGVLPKSIKSKESRSSSTIEENSASSNGMYYLTKADIGKNRAVASLQQLTELNSYVSVHAHTEDLSEDFLKKFKVSNRSVKSKIH